MLEAVKSYYEDKLARFGTTPQGVDWKDAEGQSRRVELLMRDVEWFSSINDLGCGYGFMVNGRIYGEYTGYDVSGDMVRSAIKRYPGRIFIHGGAEALREADWTLASGIFNVKCDATIAEWEAHILRTLAQMLAKSRIGIGFNMLCDLATDRKQHLYYGNVEQYALWALNQGLKVTIYHDVKHEYTMIARKD